MLRVSIFFVYLNGCVSSSCSFVVVVVGGGGVCLMRIS